MLNYQKMHRALSCCRSIQTTLKPLRRIRMTMYGYYVARAPMNVLPHLPPLQARVGIRWGLFLWILLPQQITK